MTAHPITDTMQRPLRDLRISVTDRCNFRCPYCMPAEVFHERYQFMQRQKLLTYDEITRLTRIITDLGAVKLRLTGGEPLVRQNIEQLVNMLSTMEGVHDFAMTTNAVLLPQKAHLLLEAGLQRLTISLDSLDETIAARMNGGKATVQQVLDGIQAAQSAGFQSMKINAVIQRGINDGDSLIQLARWCREQGHTLRLIEYMDVGTMNGWRLDDVIPAKEMLSQIDAVFPLERIPRDYASETALRYRYQDGIGEIGVIASVTMPFCGNCSRMRLSADGKIYTCLFATEGTDLKTPMRDGATDDDLRQLITNTWQTRTDQYSEERTDNTRRTSGKVEMYYIGG